MLICVCVFVLASVMMWHIRYAGILYTLQYLA
jgi:hypothetical protein